MSDGMVVVAPVASFHHTHHHHRHHDAAASAAASDAIFPLLSAGPCVLDTDVAKSAAAASGGIQFWQSAQQQLPSTAAGGGSNPNHSLGAFYPKNPLPMLDAGGGGSSGSGTTTCQDCGNKAKKDCSHSRCRSCCKSRGFNCSSHVKRTWVPVARRRACQHLGVASGSASSPATASTAAASKKPRLLSSHATTSHTSTTPRSFDTTSSHQDASFRGDLRRQARAPAVFRCVRVTSIDDDGEDKYAYQATVTINGHAFKGFLYDQGVVDGRARNDVDSTSAGAVPNMSELHLGGGSGNAARGGGGSSSMVASDMYGGSGARGGGDPRAMVTPSYGYTMN